MDELNKNKREKENSQTAPVDSEFNGSIILFDGVCKLCNTWINFVIDHDPARKIRFASLQSEAGRRVLLENGLNAEYLGSLVLVEGGQCFFRSTSVLQIIKHLNGPWPLLAVFSVIPETIRDWVYDRVASRRYRWFGRQETCRIPTPDLEVRFLK